MSKKYTLLILLLAGTGTMTMAQNGGRNINVLYLDGSDHIMTMSEVERIEIGSNAITVVPQNGTAMEHSMDNILGIWLNGTTSGICNRVKRDNDITLTVAPESVTVAGATAKATVRLYNTAGQQIAKSVCRDGQTTISTAGLAAGTYVIKVDDMTQKFIKK